MDSNNYTDYAAAKFTVKNLTASNVWRPIVVHNCGTPFSTYNAQLFDQANSTNVQGTYLSLGNSTGTGTAGNKCGILRLYGAGAPYVDIYGSASASRQVYTPNTSGRLAAIPDASAAVGNTSTPVYVTADGVVTACTINKSGSWHSNGVAYQAGAALKIGRYIDFHCTAASKNDYDVRLDSGASRNSLTVSYPAGASTGAIIRNIQVSTTDLIAGSSALSTGIVYLVY